MKGDAAADPTVRRSAVGSSDAAVVMGESPFRSEYQLWLEKTGRATPPPPTGDALEAGIRLEREVLQWFHDLHEDRDVFTLVDGAIRNLSGDTTLPAVAKTMLGTVRMKGDNRVMCHVDGVAFPVAAERGHHEVAEIVEAKTSLGWHGGAHYGEGDGKRIVPPYVWWQCQHQSMVIADVLGREKPPVVHVALLATGPRFLNYRVEPDTEAQGDLLEAYDEFWWMVDNDKPPAYDPGRDEKALASQREIDPDLSVKVPEDLEAVGSELVSLAAQAKRIKVKQTERRTLLVAAMGSAKVMRGPNWSMSWVNRSERKVVNWEGICRDLVNPRDLAAKLPEYTDVRSGGGYYKFNPPRGGK